MTQEEIEGFIQSGKLVQASLGCGGNVVGFIRDLDGDTVKISCANRDNPQLARVPYVFPVSEITPFFGTVAMAREGNPSCSRRKDIPHCSVCLLARSVAIPRQGQGQHLSLSF
jgi:hypothetical protein